MIFSLRTFPLLLLIVLSATVGCTSIKSTLLNRADDDSFVGNSNGQPRKHFQTRPFRGVPITVRVPTHVDIAIREKIRFQLLDGQLHRLDTTKRHLFVDTDLIYTDKVFTVDIKRPAAGTLDYTMTFGDSTDPDSRQYFKSIKSKIVDETIADVNQAISTVFSAVSVSTQGTDGTDVLESGDLYFEEPRTVAWQRFDVDAVDFEHCVTSFVEHHLNHCNTCLEYQATTEAAYAEIPPHHVIPKPMADDWISGPESPSLPLPNLP